MMNNSLPQRPLMGVAVIVLNKTQVLLGKRIGSHGANTWNFPGGHLDFNEEPEVCAKREVYEEAGIEIKNIRKAAFTNDVFESEKKHYVTLFLTAEYVSGEAKIKEPAKCLEWGWFSWDNLPTPLFLPIKNLLKQNFNPFSPSKK
jgi:8-oxo-dGTP diphosphatase